MHVAASTLWYKPIDWIVLLAISVAVFVDWFGTLTSPGTMRMRAAVAKIRSSKAAWIMDETLQSLAWALVQFTLIGAIFTYYHYTTDGAWAPSNMNSNITWLFMGINIAFLKYWPVVYSGELKWQSAIAVFLVWASALVVFCFMLIGEKHITYTWPAIVYGLQVLLTTYEFVTACYVAWC